MTTAPPRRRPTDLPAPPHVMKITPEGTRTVPARRPFPPMANKAGPQAQTGRTEAVPHFPCLSHSVAAKIRQACETYVRDGHYPAAREDGRLPASRCQSLMKWLIRSLTRAIRSRRGDAFLAFAVALSVFSVAATGISVAAAVSSAASDAVSFGTAPS